MGKVSSTNNNKIEGIKYSYIHSMDCTIYVTYCNNCETEVGGWSIDESNREWEKHCC